MSALWDILGLLSSSPGSLIYYLILLFCIWAIVGLTLSRWSRGERGGLVARLLFAGALMSFSRFLPFVVALLSRQGDLALSWFAPPLERFVDALSVLLVCWAFVFPHRYRIASRVVLGISILLTLVLYVLSASSWLHILDAIPQATYNGWTWQSRIWEVWQLGFLILAFVYTLANPTRERDALNIGLGVLVTGHLLQLVYPLAEQINHAAAWTRFANLIAFPLFGVATYQFAIQRFDAQMEDIETLNQESLAQMAGLMSVLDANLKVFASLDVETVLHKSLQAVSQVLQSDLCALLLLVPRAAGGHLEDPESVAKSDTIPELPDSPDVSGSLDEEMELTLVYDASRLVSGDQSIRLGQYPALQRALTQSNPLVLEPHAPHSLELAQAAQDLDRVYRLLDVEPGGSLLIQSLECASQVFGVLLACRTPEQGPFTTSDRRKSEMLAAHLGTAISNARRFQEIRVRLGQLDVELGAAETRHTRIRTDLENRLTRAEEQATLYMQRLYEAELGEQQAQEDAQEARRKLAALRQEGQAEVVHARDELKRSIQQVTYLTQQIANLDAQCLQLGSLVQALEQEKGLLQLRLAVVATEQDAFAADAEPTLVQTPLLSGSDSQTADTWPTDRLIPALVHDLGASLASLLEYAELFANSMSGGLEYRQGELLKRVQASTERLQGMLGNLTSLIAMDGGTPVLKLAPVDVAKVIEVALARAKFRLEDKDLQTRLEIGVLPTLRVDPAYMQQIMDNLVSYACRSSRSGAIISIRAYANAQDSGVRQLHITVSNTDPGSNPELQRADTERRAVVVESQAELLIIRMLVEVHQGQIQFGDELGTSTVVHLTMPIESVQTPEHRGDGRG